MPKQELSVDVTCEGCSNAVTRVLNKPAVQFDLDMPNKKVCISSEHSVGTLLETLGKAGKAVSYLSPKQRGWTCRMHPHGQDADPLWPPRKI
ncbi:hypothetical protein FD754_019322 [Muntiacus muntjak]|uniref:Copper transport protein ATOX1 n=1 Tax=Muntiacus muntjak TaxID=9888 RepID=A0A5N3UZT5_MUNMU|nr:hypothetical protein FD754_019322 [Muntiacus muntjak]